MICCPRVYRDADDNKFRILQKKCVLMGIHQRMASRNMIEEWLDRYANGILFEVKFIDDIPSCSHHFLSTFDIL